MKNYFLRYLKYIDDYVHSGYYSSVPYYRKGYYNIGDYLILTLCGIFIMPVALLAEGVARLGDIRITTLEDQK